MMINTGTDNISSYKEENSELWQVFGHCEVIVSQKDLSQNDSQTEQVLWKI